MTLTHRTAGRVAVVPTEATEEMLAPYGYAGVWPIGKWERTLAAADPSLTADVEAVIVALRALVADLPTVSNYDLLENARAALAKWETNDEQ